MACSWPCCATCCSFLSAFGVVFLLILGCLMQQKSPSIELDKKVMEEQYMAPYICAGVYFIFFVVSCVYLYIHSRKKPAPKPGLFPLGSMAEVGDRDLPAAPFDAPAAAAPAAAAVPLETATPRRAASNTSPLSAGGSLSKISPREDANSNRNGDAAQL